MNIVVCIKQVPDVPTIRIDSKRMTIIREGVESIINPLDTIALEAAMELRGEEGSITVLSMGPPQSKEALLEALAFGADRAVLLTDKAFAGADTLATSHVLAKAVSHMEQFPDLILCGQHTIDSDTGHVGPQIAEELHLPQVCGVKEIHPEKDFLSLKRLNDGFLDTLRVRMPVLLTVSKDLCASRHIPMGDLERAFTDRQVIQWGADELGLREDEVGLTGSATQVLRLHKPSLKKEGDIVTGPPTLLAEQIIKKLESLGILDEDQRYE